MLSLLGCSFILSANLELFLCALAVSEWVSVGWMGLALGGVCRRVAFSMKSMNGSKSLNLVLFSLLTILWVSLLVLQPTLSLMETCIVVGAEMVFYH